MPKISTLSKLIAESDELSSVPVVERLQMHGYLYEERRLKRQEDAKENSMQDCTFGP